MLICLPKQPFFLLCSYTDVEVKQFQLPSELFLPLQISYGRNLNICTTALRHRRRLSAVSCQGCVHACVPGRRGQCGCGRVQTELIGWAALGRGSGNHSRWCFQNEGHRWAVVGRQAEGRRWLGRWARGWTNPPWGCPCWPRSLSSKSLPLHRCSPSHCFGCRREEQQILRAWLACVSLTNANNHAAYFCILHLQLLSEYQRFILYYLSIFKNFYV